MKKVWNIVGRVTVWVAIVAFLVAAALLRRQNEAQRKVEEFRVVVADSARLSMISAAELAGLIEQGGLNPVGRSIDSIGLLAINNLAEEQALVATARTFVDYDNVVTLEVTQREPVVRFALDGGVQFYATAKQHILPTRNQAPIDVPIVTGDFDVPFPKGFTGDLRAWARANEKNSDKNYIFLCKLTNFVRYTEQSPALRGKIVQIILSQRGLGSRATTTLSLIPREGNYVVSLGELENVADKLDRWQRFVEAGVVSLDGGTLSLEYDGQAVWQPAQPKDNKNKKKK
jgi:hypothetical protein